MTVTYRDAVTFEERQVAATRSIAELLAAPSAQLLEGAAVYAFAEALATGAGREGHDTTVDQAKAALAAAEAVNPSDADLAEIRQVLEAL